jgi:hypothetical protein
VVILFIPGEEHGFRGYSAYSSYAQSAVFIAEEKQAKNVQTKEGKEKFGLKI